MITRNNKVIQLFARPTLRRRPRASAPEQLELRLDGSFDVYFLATSDLIAETYVKNVSRIRPRNIIDLRFAPRFDFAGSSSRRMFLYTSEESWAYQQIPYPFHGVLRPSAGGSAFHDLTTALRKWAKGHRPVVGPILVLVELNRHAAVALPIVSTIFKLISGHVWHVFLLDKTFAETSAPQRRLK